MKKQIIHIDNSEISILSQDTEVYISLTDMVHSQMQEHIIFRWMGLKSTIEYIDEWESLYNPNFNYTEFGILRNAAGNNNYHIHTDVIKQNLISLTSQQISYVYADEVDVLNVALFGMTAKQWCDVNWGLKKYSRLCYNK